MARAGIESLLLGLTRRVRPEARWVRASVGFDLGAAGTWGMYIDSGRALCAGELPQKPDLLVQTSPEVLTDVLEMRVPGYRVFLDGTLAVRGNLSLAIELQSLFEPPVPVSPGWPEATHVRAGKIRWSLMRAGPPEAPVVLLIHGLGGSKASFLRTLDTLSDSFRVIACDLPGFGASSRPVARYDAPWFAERVLQLLDVLGIREAGLVGNSMGGRISLEVAFRAPERVRGLGLLCPALAFVRGRRAVPVVRLMRPELGAMPLRPRRRTVERGLRSIFADPDRMPRAWFDAAADEFLRVQTKPRARMAFYAAARHIYLDEPHGEEGFWQRLRSLEPPAHFIFGDRDPLISPRFSNSVSEALPGTQVTVLRNCGHVPQLEKPDETDRLIRRVLA